MFALVHFFFTLLLAPLRSKSALEAENAPLRQQIIVLRRRVRGRVKLSNADRLFFVWLYRLFPSISRALLIIRPDTLVRWHRAGFRSPAPNSEDLRRLLQSSENSPVTEEGLSYQSPDSNEWANHIDACPRRSAIELKPRHSLERCFVGPNSADRSLLHELAGLAGGHARLRGELARIESGRADASGVPLVGLEDGRKVFLRVALFGGIGGSLERGQIFV